MFFILSPIVYMVGVQVSNMKLYKRLITLTVFMTVISSLFFGVNKENVYASEPGKKVDIVFTHDIHSYLASYEVIGKNGQTEEVGGMARLSTLLNDQRAKNPDTLVVDCGDIAMGTLYQTRFAEDALELRTLGKLGFDATTIGNHEFDYGTDGLVSMFNAAADSGDPLPQYLLANVDWSADDEATKSIHAAMERCNLKDYTIIEKNGVKIAIIGILGDDAIDCAPTAELTFTEQSDAVKRCIDEIKAAGGADMYLCLSHSGTSDIPDKSEDEILAREVPELDVIISAHSHTVLGEEIAEGNTHIVSCGCYGDKTGIMSLTSNDSGRWTLDSYELIDMDASIEEDEEIKELISSYDDIIDDNYLKNYGLSANKVLAYNNVAFCSIDDVYDYHTELNLGDFLSDAYRYAFNQTQEGKEHPADVAVAPSGTIRGTYPLGAVTTQKVFESFSLGEGFDNSVGYPLIDFYLTGKELKTLCEVDASVSDLMTSARLYMSGVSFSYNPHRMILNKVTDSWMSPEIMVDDRVEIEDDKLYHIISDLYSGRMLGAVTSVSKGILAIHPLDENGNELPMIDGEYDYEAVCAYNDDGTELKTWVAIADYMQSFDKNEDCISVIPEYYASNEHSRKVVETDKNIIKLVSHPNKIAMVIYLIIIVLIIIIILLVRAVILLIRKIVNRKNTNTDNN